MPWALEQLGAISVDLSPEPGVDLQGADVVVATADSLLGRTLLAQHGIAPPDGTESFVRFSGRVGTDRSQVAIGSDARGVAYALMEISERATTESGHALGAPVRHQAANRIRGVARAFVSEGADKSWFHSEGFWGPYLDRLAIERFNRFHLALGMGYDFHYQDRVVDTYLLFPYPFLVRVPGYAVHAEGLPPDEMDRNLGMLRHISDEATRRGLHFQLGIWTHGYQWTEGGAVNYRLRGLTPENHAPYCREALAYLLEACPSIAGVTLRVHGESGIGEDQPDFWRNVFAGISDVGRPIEIDLHPKGLAHEVVDSAVSSGMPVILSPKYAAEHLGLPYHLTEIRAVERRSQRSSGAPGASETPAALRSIMQLSAGTRAFTRYSYGDFLRQNRPYDILYRVWPGTQRLLRWGDPAFAAALSRSGRFGGAAGVEVCEPMYFAGRRGSPGERVRSSRDDDAFAYTYRVLGRHLYDPSASTEVDRAPLGDGANAQALQEALAPVSRILPLITMAHCPSAANNSFWPEVYTNMPIAPGLSHHYRDTPLPRTFGSVSALDPAMFSSVNEFVDEALSQLPSGRYTPLQVAGWLEQLAAAGLHQLPEGELTADVILQAGIGRFFAAKFRAAVLYELGRRLADRPVLDLAVAWYRKARSVWSELAGVGSGAYSPDLVFGPEPWLRGSWADRLPAIDQDLEAMRPTMPHGDTDLTADETGNAWLQHLEALAVAPPLPSAVRVAEAPSPGDGMVIVSAEVTTAGPYGPPQRVTLHHRPINQAERYSCVEMTPLASGIAGFEARVPTDPTFGTQYYFTVTAGARRWVYPGIGPDLLRQPYLVAGERDPEGQ